MLDPADRALVHAVVPRQVPSSIPSGQVQPDPAHLLVRELGLRVSIPAGAPAVPDRAGRVAPGVTEVGFSGQLFRLSSSRWQTSSPGPAPGPAQRSSPPGVTGPDGVGARPAVGVPTFGEPGRRAARGGSGASAARHPAPGTGGRPTVPSRAPSAPHTSSSRTAARTW